MGRSQMFKYYSGRLSRVTSPDELLKLSKEIASKSFPAAERAALVVSCAIIAKQFDKKGVKLKEGVVDEAVSVDCFAEE